MGRIRTELAVVALVANAGMDGQVIDIFVQNVVDGFALDVFWEAMHVVYLKSRVSQKVKSRQVFKVGGFISSPHYVVT